MEIGNFFKSLVPSFSKDTVLDDCKATRVELQNTVVPAYKQGAELLKNAKFKSAEVAKFDKDFRAGADKAQGNIIVSIDKMLPVIIGNIEECEDLVKRTFGEEVAAGGLTYMKAQLLQLVEASAFFAKYARQFLIFVYVMESAPFTEATDEQYDAIKSHLTPAEILFISENFRNFVTVFNALTIHSADVRKKLEAVPDVVITADNVQTMPHTVGAVKLDPLKMGFIASWLNPIYHIRMAIADYQFNRYKAAQAELQLLQMRKLNLERLLSGQPPNAALQRDIEYMERRIGDLRAKITKMERDYA